MADPHIQSPMDFWDYLTVVLYRTGFSVAAFSLAIFPYWQSVAHVLLLVSGVLLASSLHLYVKSIRLLFQFAMWIGLLCQIFDLGSLAIGAVFLVVGGLCYKEHFCFRVWGLNFQPILLALLWVAIYVELRPLVVILCSVCGLWIFFLTFMKWKMPMHFDIGDKRQYQI